MERSYIRKWKRFLTEGTVRIGNLEVYDAPLPQKMTWDKATAAAQALGDGWRLATKQEFILLFKNRDKIPNLVEGAYWTSELVANKEDDAVAWRAIGVANKPKVNEYFVLPVKG